MSKHVLPLTLPNPTARPDIYLQSLFSTPARIIGPDRQTIATMAAKSVSVLKFVGTVSLGVLTVRPRALPRLSPIA
jgi:hypothetical protein